MTAIPAHHRNGTLARIAGFFHEPEIPFGMALTRIVLPWALLGALLRRWYYTRELFSSDGVPTPLWESYGYPDLLPIPSGTVAVAIHSALIFCLVCSSLGWRTRFSLAVSFVLYTYLSLLDAVGTITKYSCIASHALLLLSLSNCGAVWSIDARRRRRRALADGFGRLAPERGPAWPRRLLQLLIGIVYFSSAITKIHTPGFFSGEQLTAWLLSHVNFDHALGEWMAMYPVLVVVSGYLTVIWEMLFIFVAFRGWGRIAMLGFGAMFHLATNLTLGLYVFPAVCLSLYFAFLDERDVRRLARHFARLQQRWAWLSRLMSAEARPEAAIAAPRFAAPAMACYGAALVLAAAGGVGLEYWLDPYGLRRPDGPYTLRELDPTAVQTLLAPPPPLRDTDKFFGLDVGTTVVGGVLLDRRTEFRQGDAVVAQCTISPPHEDMWVECNLHDELDRTIDRSGSVVTRDVMRASFNYGLTGSLRPGDYYLVLKRAGREITRRKITLHPGGPGGTTTLASPVAN